MTGVSRLSRKVLSGLAVGLLIASLIFLVLFIEIYRHQLSLERGLASDQVNRLMQVSLENAMLKRDLPGLQDIVNRLGQQPGIVSVRIINPHRQVRFASQESALGTSMSLSDIGCNDCADGVVRAIDASTHIVETSSGEVLRGVHPIHNKAECKGCHGPAGVSPINGILVVDHDVAGIRSEALRAAGLMSGAGLLVVLVGMSTGWLVLRKQVLKPILALDTASRDLAAGDLKVRVATEPQRDDELVDLFKSFNRMADTIETGVKEVREKEAFLQSLIDTVPDGVRVIDENYTVVMVNTSYARQAETDGAVIGVPCYAIHGRTERCPPTMLTCPFHAIKADGEPIKYIHRHVKGDGSELFVETTAARLRQTKDGKQQTFIVEAIRDLEQPVKYSQEQRLSEIGQLAAGVAHEIYNPLASVRLGLQALLRRAKTTEQVDPEIGEYLNMVDGEVEKCIRVTKRLLDLSQVPSQSLQLVSLSTVIPEVVSLLRYEAEQEKITLKIDLGETDLRVLATDSELRMLALNLTQNAFHAMPNGGTLAITGEHRNGEVVVSFADTGVGIEPDVLSHIFEPFFSKRADGVAGTGLGLTICKAITTRYQGRIEVQSTLNVGTKFTLVFPEPDGNRTLS